MEVNEGFYFYLGHKTFMIYVFVTLSFIWNNKKYIFSFKHILNFYYHKHLTKFEKSISYDLESLWAINNLQTIFQKISFIPNYFLFLKNINIVSILMFCRLRLSVLSRNAVLLRINGTENACLTNTLNMFNNIANLME